MSDLLDPEKLADRLNVEFKDDCQDRLDIVYDILARLKTEQIAQDDALIVLRREASKLRGIGSTFGFPLVNLIAHRMESYLGGNLTKLNEKQQEDNKHPAHFP